MIFSYNEGIGNRLLFEKDSVVYYTIELCVFYWSEYWKRYTGLESTNWYRIVATTLFYVGDRVFCYFDSEYRHKLVVSEFLLTNIFRIRR